MTDSPIKRYALVRNARDDDELTALLPDNYTIAAKLTRDVGKAADVYPPITRERPAWIIEGRDVAGWTLNRYVIPRLQSAIIRADEIDLSHPLMKLVPA